MSITNDLDNIGIFNEWIGNISFIAMRTRLAYTAGLGYIQIALSV